MANVTLLLYLIEALIWHCPMSRGLGLREMELRGAIPFNPARGGLMSNLDGCPRGGTYFAGRLRAPPLLTGQDQEIIP
jgi:hypothetical protein